MIEVICIESISDSIQSKFKYIVKPTGKFADRYVLYTKDYRYITHIGKIFYESYFITLEEYRHQQLDKLLND